MLFSQRFFCRPLLLPPCTVPCKIVLTSPSDVDTCPNHINLRFFTVLRYHHKADSVPDCVVSVVVSVWDAKQSPKHLSSVTCNFSRMSAVNVRVSLAYNSTEITRERITLSFELREICLSFQMVLSLSLVLLLNMSMQFWTVLQAWNLDLWRLRTDTWRCQSRPIFAVDPNVTAVAICVFGHQLVFSVLISMPKAAEVLSRRSTREASSTSLYRKWKLYFVKRIPKSQRNSGHHLPLVYQRLPPLCLSIEWMKKSKTI